MIEDRKDSSLWSAFLLQGAAGQKELVDEAGGRLAYWFKINEQVFNHCGRAMQFWAEHRREDLAATIELTRRMTRIQDPSEAAAIQQAYLLDCARRWTDEVRLAAEDLVALERGAEADAPVVSPMVPQAARPPHSIAA